MEGDRLKQLVAKVGKEELREDENSRKQSLEQLRAWIKKNTDITGCRTDDAFLLRFLRTKKFSVPLAEQLLVNYINFRQNYKDIMFRLDINERDTNDIISNGLSFVCPFRDDCGRQVLIHSFGNFDYKKYDWKAMDRAVQLNHQCVMEDEVSQVLGVTVVFDMANSTPFYTLYPIRDLYNLCVNTDKSYPVRFKQVNIINLPSIGTKLVKLILSRVSEKIQERTKIHDSVEDLKKVINPSVLPKELGGTMPRREMIDLWRKQLLAKREDILALNKMRVQGGSLKVMKDVGEVSGLSGSFKKLEVD